MRLRQKEAGLGARAEKAREGPEAGGSPGLLTCPLGPRKLVGAVGGPADEQCSGHLLGRCQGMERQQQHWDPLLTPPLSPNL